MSKVIQGNKVLENINLTIRKGETLAITGHNGSGKSSLLKLMAGFYKETAGIVKNHAEKISYVPEHFPEGIRFSVLDYLMLIGQMNGRRKAELQSEINVYSKELNIESYLHTILKKCSKGTKQKVGIIQALLAKPDFLLMDEPLTGLDQRSCQHLLKVLASVKGNCTLVYVVHDRKLIDQLADRVIEIETGTIRSWMQVENDRVKVIKVLVRNKESLQEIEQEFPVQFDQEDIARIFVNSGHSDALLIKLIESGCSIVEVRER